MSRSGGAPNRLGSARGWIRCTERGGGAPIGTSTTECGRPGGLLGASHLAVAWTQTTTDCGARKEERSSQQAWSTARAGAGVRGLDSVSVLCCVVSCISPWLGMRSRRVPSRCVRLCVCVCVSHRGFPAPCRRPPRRAAYGEACYKARARRGACRPRPTSSCPHTWRGACVKAQARDGSSARRKRRDAMQGGTGERCVSHRNTKIYPGKISYIYSRRLHCHCSHKSPWESLDSISNAIFCVSGRHGE